MALEENGTGMYMPVAPAYGAYGGNNGGFGNFGLGGDGAWLLLFILLCGGGWGGFGGFGGGMMWPMMGMGMMDGFGGFGLYPWMNQAEITTNGFQNQGLNSAIAGLQNSVTSGFGDVQLGIAGINQGVSNAASGIQNTLCQGFAGVNQTVSNGFAGTSAAINGAQNAIASQLYGNEIANLNRSFAEQTANTQGFTGVNSGLADLKYTVATENCADRTAAAQNTRDIIDAQTRGTQAILDKLCALELDTVKSQLAQAQRDNVGLQNQLNMANLAASQIDQTAQIRAGQTAAVNSLVNELRSCPIPAQPVYGSQPIFTCPNNNSGCGCNGNGFVG